MLVFFQFEKFSIYYYEIILFHLPPPHLSLSPMRKKTCKASAMDAPARSPFLTFFFLFSLSFWFEFSLLPHPFPVAKP
jgi:hypothetical protein